MGRVSKAPRKLKGPKEYPQPRKTERRELPDWLKVAIVATSPFRSAGEEEKIWENHPDYKPRLSTIKRIRQTAKLRAEASGLPLADISHVQNIPRHPRPSYERKKKAKDTAENAGDVDVTQEKSTFNIEDTAYEEAFRR